MRTGKFMERCFSSVLFVTSRIGLVNSEFDCLTMPMLSSYLAIP